MFCTPTTRPVLTLTSLKVVSVPPDVPVFQ
jgi:hypothetical protein